MLSIRTRLTFWYAGIVLVVLTAASAAMVTSQTRLGLRRIDDELERLANTISTVLNNELDERFDLARAAEDATEEIEMRGRTVVILTADGHLLAASPDNPGVLTAATVATLRPTSHLSTIATPGSDTRMIAVSGLHNGHAYTVRVAMSLAGLAADRSALMQLLGIGFGLALLLAALGGWIIGKQALRPLVSMARETGAMTTATVKERLTLPATRDELEQLGHAFNGLLQRLEAALSAQRQFMTDASHELRTPVSVTRTTAQVTLGQLHRTEGEYRDSLSVVAEQSERLTRMVDDMFLLARADAYARPIEVSAIYLDELIDECTRAVRVLAETKGVKLSVAGDRDVSFAGDENLLRQLLINLLENGVAHTPEGGHVTVELARKDGRVELTVSDSGPGIALVDRDRIFERFVRLGPSGRRGGAGLGLPIARWIAERHGGRLTLESSAPAGARFIVSLPISRS